MDLCFSILLTYSMFSFCFHSSVDFIKLKFIIEVNICMLINFFFYLQHVRQIVTEPSACSSASVKTVVRVTHRRASVLVLRDGLDDYVNNVRKTIYVLFVLFICAICSVLDDC